MASLHIFFLASSILLTLFSSGLTATTGTTGSTGSTGTTGTTGVPPTTPPPIICQNTGHPPHQPKFDLKFCNQFNAFSCCTSGQDEDVMNLFMGVTDLGEKCPFKRKDISIQLFQYLCFGCSPNQPLFMSNTGVNGTAVIRLCRSFANALYAQNPDGTTKWDDCGIRIGGTVQIPSTVYGPPGTATNDAILAFIAAIPPPNFQGIPVMIVELNDTGGPCYAGLAPSFFANTFLIILLTVLVSVHFL